MAPNGRSRKHREPEPTQATQEEPEVDLDGGDDDEPATAYEAEEKKAQQLVRLALFTEYKRGLLKRDEINKRVLGTGTRSFNHVFERAQTILRKTFGMELFEVQTRAERDSADKEKDGESSRRGKKGPTSSKAYILRSTLDSALIEAANVKDDKINAEENRIAQDAEHNSEDEGDYAPEGTLFAWRHADHLGSIGVLYVILALILVNGKELPDMQLRGYLKRLHLPANASLSFPIYTVRPPKPPTIETLLTLFQKQSYLDKEKTSAAGGNTGKKGRPSAAAGNDDGDAAFQWKWGPRALAEISEKAVAEFVVDFMLEKRRGEIEEEEEEDNITDAERAKRRKAKEDKLQKIKDHMTESVRRDAGGTLADYTAD
ncbi:MAGE-domain-containing protein [Sistotremastrum suecicum HHB10207 ss-3]|uniref:MAGE-domain-containing protein n=1 Tax=Sistotremastrum suecicum HHB10207 ss-3 TaxID=1314776 RepID=A0A165YD72_9AGAM|nr:MAGE-domain-containing protein [Sistotremastrum suecicum HHB10207 ss-3]